MRGNGYNGSCNGGGSLADPEPLKGFISFSGQGDGEIAEISIKKHQCWDGGVETTKLTDNDRIGIGVLGFLITCVMYMLVAKKQS